MGKLHELLENVIDSQRLNFTVDLGSSMISVWISHVHMYMAMGFIILFHMDRWLKFIRSISKKSAPYS